jgi:hypothetical protein
MDVRVFFDVGRYISLKHVGRCEPISVDGLRGCLMNAPSRSAKVPRRHFELLNYDISRGFNFSFVSLSQQAERVLTERGCYVPEEEASPARTMGTRAPKLFYHAFLYPSESQFADEIRERFRLLIPLSADNARKLAKIRGTNSICMHVRRGDYTAHSNLGYRNCSPRYFSGALRSVMRWTGWHKATVFVFSDDLPWCEKHIDFAVPGADVEADFVNVNGIDSPVFEMELMRACRHFILSVGNFGRMAAELAGGRRIVLSPLLHRDEDWYVETLPMLVHGIGHHTGRAVRSALASVGLMDFARRVRRRIRDM